MRRALLFLVVLALVAGLEASPWGLDLGPAFGFGFTRFAGEPAGREFLGYPPESAQGGYGLLGSVGLAVDLHYRRRTYLGLQVLWQGQSVGQALRYDFGGGTHLQQDTLWEWQSLALPLTLSRAWPVYRGAATVLAARAGLGLWYQAVLAPRRKHVQADASSLEQAWAGPPDDWGPLALLALDWVRLQDGRRQVSFELRGQRGQAPVDPGGGVELPVWSLEFKLVVPVWMKVL
jgi:hypothetical protein